MAAFFVVELEVKNMDAMAQYRASVPATLGCGMEEEGP